MIHVQHTSIACRAVVTAFGLENIAHQAISAALILWVAKVEAPEHGDLPWISSHRLEE
jgi:hypothetical protein